MALLLYRFSEQVEDKSEMPSKMRTFSMITPAG